MCSILRKVRLLNGGTVCEFYFAKEIVSIVSAEHAQSRETSRLRLTSSVSTAETLSTH